MTENNTIALSSETGRLAVFHLKRLWSRTMATLNGSVLDQSGDQHADMLVTDALGLGMKKTFEYLYRQRPTFNDFENWILREVGAPEENLIARLNAAIAGTQPPENVRIGLASVEQSDPVLSDKDMVCWAENGYVVVKDVVDEESRAAAEKAVWDYVGADPSDEETWYQNNQSGIMVELIQHPALEKNRRSARIHKAFAQLWETADLWVTADRCGFHVPQRYDTPFPGPDLHWDIDLCKPCSFRTQGILYLTETPPEQGALTLVPGFHNRLSGWLAELDKFGADPIQQDLHALGSVPVAGNGGDMIIWHQALPHGSRPNLGKLPRIVQYINMYPGVLPSPNDHK